MPSTYASKLVDVVYLALAGCISCKHVACYNRVLFYLLFIVAIFVFYASLFIFPLFFLC